MIEDTLLILRFKSGSADALSQIYSKYSKMLLNAALAISNDTAAAEDAVHDVFLDLARSPQRISLRGNLRSYLATCVANRLRNSRKRQARVRPMDIEIAGSLSADENPPHDWIIAGERTRSVNRALARLPGEQREVVVLHLHAKMRFRSIAALQDVSINTVQSRYRYALQKLRSELQDEAKP